MLARRYYFARAEAKLLYQLPLTVGVHVSGLRITSLQSDWAWAVITGNSRGVGHTRLPRDVRRRLYDDLGWQCLWVTAKVAAVALFAKCQNDHATFAHTKMCLDSQGWAIGGWMASVKKLQDSLGIQN